MSYLADKGQEGLVLPDSDGSTVSLAAIALLFRVPGRVVLEASFARPARNARPAMGTRKSGNALDARAAGVPSSNAPGSFYVWRARAHLHRML